jgi:hypothetical protein
MRNLTVSVSLSLVASASLFACGDSPRRPIGAVCGDETECASGLCVNGRCLDPEGDEDGDTLTNGFEASLGSDPDDGDTDGDGKLDALEVGDVNRPADTDGDGVPDVRESATADADGDCIPDEVDPIDAGVEPNGCGAGDVVDGDVSKDVSAVDVAPDSDVPDGTILPADTGPEDVGPTDAGHGDADDGDTAPTDAATGDLPDGGTVATPCTQPVTIVSDADGPPFHLGRLFDAPNLPTLLMYQDYSRVHYARFFDGTAWTDAAEVARGIDINPTSHVDFASTGPRVTAFRGENLNFYEGGLGVRIAGEDAWRAPVMFAGLGQTPGSHVVLDNGEILVVVASNYNREVDLVRWNPDLGFSDRLPLFRLGAEENCFETALAVDGTGTGIVFAYVAAGARILARPLGLGLPMAGEARLEPTEPGRTLGSDFVVAPLRSGGALVAAIESNGRLIAADVSFEEGGATWTPTVIVDPGEAAVPALNVDVDGNATLLYVKSSRTFAARRDAGARWRAPVDVGPPNGERRRVVTDAAGATWAAWVERSDQAIVLARAPAGADDWTVVQRVEAGGDVLSVNRPHLGLTPDGDLLAVWQAVRMGGTDGDVTVCRAR